MRYTLEENKPGLRVPTRSHNGKMKLRTALAAALLILGTAASAHAAIQQVRVMAVGVDRSANKAEALAMEYAKRRAVYLTARKLPVDNVGAKVQAFKAQDFKDIVRGAEVNQIKRVGERTYADVTVSIVDNALRRALDLPEQSYLDGVSEEQTRMRGVLVLPVYVKSARPYLWEKDNLLRAPLRSESLRQAHGAVLTPAGDLDDLRLVDYNNVLSVTGKELEPMFKRYGAEEIVIAIYTPPASGKEPVEESIILRRLTPSQNQAEKVQIPDVSDGDNAEARLKRASILIANAVTQIASATAIDDQARLAKAKQIPIDFKYANPRELAMMQEALRSQREVLLVKLPTISLSGIDGIAYVEGDVQKLREKLKKAGIFVIDSGNGWTLSLR